MRRQFLTIALFWLQVSAANAQWEFVRVDDGTKPAIALGLDCVAEVSYMLERTAGYVRHAQISRGALPLITAVDEGYFYGPLDVAASSSGDVYINYHDHDYEDQVVALRSNNVWELLRVEDPGHDGWDNSILVTEDGIVHTSSVDPSGFGGRGVEHARRSTSGVWNVEAVGSPQIMYANATSIVIQANGAPAIAYYNDTTTNLELAEQDGGVWTVSVVDSVGDVGRFPSLGIDASGDLHVAYYHHLGGTDGAIRHARRSGGTWTISEVDTLADVQLGFTGARRNVALDVDEDNTIHLVYGDRSVVMYATGLPGDWTYETVVDETASLAVLGQQVDMQRCVDDGEIHIVYYVFETPSSEGVVWYAMPVSSTAVDEIQSQRLLRMDIYPNPSDGHATIRVEGELRPGDPVTLKIIDMLGRTILSQSVGAFSESAVGVDLEGLATGVYVAYVRSGEHAHAAPFLVAGRE